MKEEKPKIYLDYLDKEMTIMGILSTFCVIVSGGALDRIAGSDKAYFKDVWNNGSPYILLGSVFALLAALFFYLQRSLLAWYYGQISLCVAKGHEEQDSPKPRKKRSEEEYDINDWYADADSWPTWIRYNIAFGFLILSFIEYGLGLGINHFPDLISYMVLGIFTPFFMAAPFYVFWFFLLLRHPYEDNPWNAFIASLRRG